MDRRQQITRIRALRTLDATVKILERLAATPELRHDQKFRSMLAEITELRREWREYLKKGADPSKND
jgi:hypothetical protein